jgi:hypothetical protein
VATLRHNVASERVETVLAASVEELTSSQPCGIVPKKRSHPKRSPGLDALVFIDTNIFLDFYRVRGTEAGLSVLKHIDANRGRIITGDQVQMEFKKNRQRVVLESLDLAKGPDWSKMQVPLFLRESSPTRAVERARSDVAAQITKIRVRIEKVLQNPARFDEVYQSAQALFKSTSPFNLSRDKDARFRIRRLAIKRFMLGYPPRKDTDTSIGDAINWEWIVRCAIDSRKHVIIVSRDSDFGHAGTKGPVLNDWLQQEFAERVSIRRKVLLTNRLTDAFKRIAVPVTKAEVEQEDEVIASHAPLFRQASPREVFGRILTPDELRVVDLMLGWSNPVALDTNDIAVAIGQPSARVRQTLIDAMVRLEQFSGKIAEDKKRREGGSG